MGRLEIFLLKTGIFINTTRLTPLTLMLFRMKKLITVSGILKMIYASSSDQQNTDSFTTLVQDGSQSNQSEPHTSAQPADARDAPLETASSSNKTVPQDMIIEKKQHFGGLLSTIPDQELSWYGTMKIIQTALKKYPRQGKSASKEDQRKETNIYEFSPYYDYSLGFSEDDFIPVSNFGIDITTFVDRVLDYMDHTEPGFIKESKIYEWRENNIPEKDLKTLSHFLYCVFENSYFKDILEKEPTLSENDPFIPIYRNLQKKYNNVNLTLVMDQLKNETTFFICNDDHPDFASPFLCLSRMLLLEIRTTMQGVICDFLMGFKHRYYGSAIFYSFENLISTPCSIIDVSYHLQNKVYNGVLQFLFFKELTKLPRFFLVTNLNYAIRPTFKSYILRCNENDFYHLISFITFENGEYVTYISKDDKNPGINFIAHRINQENTYQDFNLLSSPPVFMVFAITHPKNGSYIEFF